ncbi:MAG TPA: NifU family protein [Isosphaeraceae bacterium]|nr:NifU family protein [Isosphaeraceae bacterium]
MLDNKQLQQQMQRLEALVHQAENFADPAAQATAREIVQLLLDVHGAGLAKILEAIHHAGKPGDTIIDACARDGLVASLLLLHGLHPLDLETRVRQALDKVRPALGSHGGNVELLAVTENRVRLRLLGSCDGCPSSAVTMRHTIEEAILVAAPDVLAIEVEEQHEASPVKPANGLVSLNLVTK